MASNTPDNEATILRPNPSGRRSNAGHKPSEVAAQTDVLAACNTPSFSMGNAFIQRAVPVLNLAVALKTLPVDTDFSRLKSDFLEEITAYKKDLSSMNLDGQAIEEATFGLAAYIDEVILSTPWASKTRWADACLLHSFFGVTWGGEKVSEILNDLVLGRSVHPELTCLFLTLLELGYQGQFEIVKNGRTQREQVIQALSDQIRSPLTRSPLEMSSQSNFPAPSRLGFADRIPLWVMASVVLFLMLLTYVGLLSSLKYTADELTLIQRPPATMTSGSRK